MVSRYPVKKILIAGRPISDFAISYDRMLKPMNYAHMCNVLQRYIAYTCGTICNVHRGMWLKDTPEFIVGPCSKNPALPENLGEDTVYIEVKDGNVHLTGEGSRGPVYAVFQFLERFLGWRFFTKDLEFCKPQEVIDIPEGAKYIYTPPFSYRQENWESAFNTEYAAKRMINAQACLTDAYGGGHHYVRHLQCHTFDDLMLKRDYPDHPEYFADVKGEDQDSDTQPPPDGMEELCLTNPDVLRIVTEKIGHWLERERHPRLVSISQNDNANGYCRCKNCRAQGTPTDNYIKFVSKIADHFKDKYPKVIFETLAYHYTQSPPSKGVKIPDNVGARLCSIRSCAAHPFTGDNFEKAKNHIFLNDLKAWSKVCKNVSVWDYEINFHNYLMPFPNFEVMRQNVALHYKLGTSHLFMQGNAEHSGEFGELRGYLCAKLLWEPQMTKAQYYAHMNEFLEAYYGPGWRNIRKFIDLLEKAAHRVNHHFAYYTPPVGQLCNPQREYIIDRNDLEFFAESEKLWNAAIRRAKTPEHKEHVNRSHLSFRYLKQSADYEREYLNGTEEQKRAYVDENESLLQDMILSGVSISEGIFVPAKYDPTRPPYTWTGRMEP